MKKSLLLIFLAAIVLAGCTSNKQIELLREQNKLLQEKISQQEAKTENNIEQSASTKGETNTTNLYLEQQIKKDQLKQSKINDAKKEREICYSNINKTLELANEMGGMGPAGVINFKNQATIDCNNEYEENLRIINLEY